MHTTESVPILRLYPSKKAMIKWTLIVGLCSFFSFYIGGLVTNWTILPMALGVLSIIFIYATIESSPRFALIKEKNDRLRRAVDIGIKIRCIYAVLTPLIGAGDLFIGMIAIRIVYSVTGIDLEGSDVEFDPSLYSPLDHDGFVYQFSVYIATIVTGFLHSILLALLCGMLYFLLPYLPVRKKNEQ